MVQKLSNQKKTAMGLCCSLCNKQNDQTGQFESLVIPKPDPVDIVDVPPDSSNSDVPLFAPAESDDNEEVADVEIIPDSDENSEADK